MKKTFVSLIAAVLLLALLLTVTVSASVSTVVWINPEDYTRAIDDFAYSFAIVGDTQKLVREDGVTHAINRYPTPPEYTSKIYDWIIDNVEEKKIAYVMGLGDICQTSNASDEWAVAKEQIKRLNGVVPYSLVRGNHDDTTSFTRVVGNENPEYVETLEGAFEKGRAAVLNNWRTLRVGGVSYLIMVLDYYPTDAVLEWANKVIAEHPHHRVIITTHGYLHNNSTLISGYDKNYAPHGGNSGKDIWNKLGKKHENIFMIISGHVATDGILVSTRQGENKNKVYELLIDGQGLDEEYISLKQDPAGLVAILYFSSDGKSVGLEYYSTVRNAYVDLFKEKLNIEPYVDVFAETTTVAPETTAIPETTVEIIETATETVGVSETKGCNASIEFVAIPLTICSGLSAVVTRKKRKK